MNADDRFEDILRAAVPPVPSDVRPSRDLWATVARGYWDEDRWAWVDVGIAAAALITLLRSPGWLWLLAYNF